MVESLLRNSLHIKPASLQEQRLLDAWFEARMQARLGEDYAFGWALLDGPEHSEAAQRFVYLDNQLKQALPHLSGLYAGDVEEYYDIMFRESRFNFLGNLQGPFLEGEARHDDKPEPLPAPAG